MGSISNLETATPLLAQSSRTVLPFPAHTSSSVSVSTICRSVNGSPIKAITGKDNRDERFPEHGPDLTRFIRLPSNGEKNRVT